MKIYLSLLLTAFTLITSCNTTHNKQETPIKKQTTYDISMYTKSNDSIKRFIIELPIEENEGLFNVEIWAGQKKMVDCNMHSLPGTFTKKTVKGWGYSYYEFTTNNLHASTRMACPEDSASEKFIRSKTEHIRYNSKLPIVVYCPNEIDLEYAIWSKPETPTKAKIK